MAVCATLATLGTDLLAAPAYTDADTGGGASGHERHEEKRTGAEQAVTGGSDAVVDAAIGPDATIGPDAANSDVAEGADMSDIAMPDDGADMTEADAPSRGRLAAPWR